MNMKFINSIGQRKTSKLLCGITFFLSLLLQVVAYGASYAANLGLWMGCILITLPNILLSMGAHFNRKYRMICIYSQVVLVVFNLVFLVVLPRKYLVTVFVSEIIITAIAALVLYALPTPPATPTRRRSSGSSNTAKRSSSSAPAKSGFLKDSPETVDPNED